MPTLIPAGNYGNVYSGSVISPMLVNSYSALTIPAFKRAVQFLSENLASFGRSIHKDGSPAITPHPLDKLIRRRPNAYQNAFNFWKTLFAHAAHRGNGYAQIERGNNFAPFALNNMLPEHICPIRYDHKDGGGVQQYYHHIPTGAILPGSDVIHVQYGLSYDGMMGIDSVCLHETTFQRAGSLDRYQTLFIQKGTNIRGTIQYPAGVTKEQVDDSKLILRTYFRGADAEEDILVLSDGATFNNTTISPKDSELSVQESAINKQIAQIMSIPPEFLYEMSESKYNTSVEQAGQNIVRYTFRQWIEQIEDELSFKLLSEKDQDAGYSVKINPGALLRGSTTEQESLVADSVNAGIRTKNEGRALLELPAVKDPDADKLKALGDTAAPASRPEKTNTPAPRQSATESKEPGQVFAALLPVFESVCRRLDQKADKAFSNNEKKPDAERVIWGNVFAGQQEKDAVDALTPLSASVVALGGEPLPVEQIAQKYAARIRKKASTGEATTSLMSLVEDSLVENK